MTSTARTLAERRELLVMRSDMQRLQLRLQWRGLTQELSPRGWALRAWDAARAHPGRWVVLGLALAAAQRAGWRRVATRAIMAWRAVQAARRWLHTGETP